MLSLLWIIHCDRLTCSRLAFDVEREVWAPRCCVFINNISNSRIFVFRWHTTDWSTCSRSCGNGLQTRDVICRKKINPTDYGPSTNCPADQKPSISEKVQYCNSIDCLADWDTQEGLLVSTSYLRLGKILWFPLLICSNCLKMYKFLIQGRAELFLLDICIPLRSRFTVGVFWKLVPSVYGESDPESLALASAGRLHQLFCSSLWLNLVKLPFFTLAEWFLPWLQHPLLPNGLYLSSYFTERQMREPIDPATLSCYW